jgi:hypothetical protein
MARMTRKPVVRGVRGQFVTKILSATPALKQQIYCHWSVRAVAGGEHQQTSVRLAHRTGESSPS